MRRLVNLSSFASFGTAFSPFLKRLQTVSSGLKSSLNKTTPTGEKLHEGMYLDQLWTGPVQETLGSGTLASDPGYAYATKVTLLTGAAAMPAPGHAHGGAFVLTVAEGAICYTNVDDSASTTTAVVTAKVAGNGTVPASCAQNVTNCTDQDGCTLDPGDMVYLPSGGWITQSNTASHWYENVGNGWAVVYLTGYGPESGAAPCRGGCG